ncbi:NAD(P)/FAD-dependent oxidoreductase [Streptomyces sp. NPDC001663]|uniref:NAD(P)/FAD-dependent oxidoreductase n=1 Tax=Streptomyces sp. NPDC001663 TaxID=3364597 RepID=UPI0036BF3AFA
MTRTVVVGAGQAASQAAQSLREFGYPGAITVIGDEPAHPYQRPPLSKTPLTGELVIDDLYIRRPTFYPDRDIRMVPGTRVTDLSFRPGDTGGTAFLEHGPPEPFDHLVLAMGGTALVPRIGGTGAERLFVLRTLADAHFLRRELGDARHLLVIGAGFVGLELAATAAAHGIEVTVVEAASRVLTRSVAPDVSALLLRAHERRDIRFRLTTTVREIHGDGERTDSVLLSDGTVLPADLVVAGIGMTPTTELGARAGLRIEGGIVVDGHGRTSRPGVHAAGDCTVQPHPTVADRLVRIESVPAAIAQARAVAADITGAAPPAPTAPWFWSQQGDLKLQMVGLIDGYERVEIEGDTTGDQFVAHYVAGERTVAVQALNAPREFAKARREMTARMASASNR